MFFPWFDNCYKQMSALLNELLQLGKDFTVLPLYILNFDVPYVVTEPWNWVMSWVDMIPHTSFVTLLEKQFFPRWLQVLGTWLSGPSPNYYEVTSWYQGWKALFSQQLLADSTVKGTCNVRLRKLSGSDLFCCVIFIFKDVLVFVIL